MLPIRCCGAVALCVVTASSGAARAQTPALDPNGSVSVIVTYADGRRAPMMVGPTSGGAETTLFPRVTEWTAPPNQQPVGAIKYVCLRTPDGVRVVISAFRGKQLQQDEPVTSVVVTPARSVIVDAELRAIGIQPVTLSVVPVVTPELSKPSVTLVSEKVEATDVTVITSPIATYAVTLRNHSTKAVRSIEIMATRGGRPALSLARTGQEGSALIAPDATYQFGVQVPAGRPGADGSVALSPIDRINITMIRWADGSYDGTAQAAWLDNVDDYAAKIQLGRIVAELERAQQMGPMATPAALRTALQGLSTDATDAMVEGSREIAGNLSPAQTGREISSALARVRKVVLDDLASFESGRAAPGAFEGWLHSGHDRYQRWLDRLGGAAK